MNAFEFAMKMELDGRKYYEEHEAKTADSGLKKIFAELAADEQRHYELFRAMAAGENPDYEAVLKTSILRTTRNIFEKLGASKKEIGAFPADFRAGWAKASTSRRNRKSSTVSKRRKAPRPTRKKSGIESRRRA